MQDKKDKNDTAIVDQQWVATMDKATALQEQLAPIAASVGMVVGITRFSQRQGGFLVTVERPWCPQDCGCRLGPDEDGNHDADRRECGCDGPCTEQG